MQRASVLVFAGSDPSGGAGIQADIEAIAAQGAHALPIITALTVQDNDRVYAVHPVAAGIMLHQAQVLTDKIPIAAIKIGIIASKINAQAIADWIISYKKNHPALPVILDPVLASGHGDALAVENAAEALLPLLRIATLITPNLPEAAALCTNTTDLSAQAQHLFSYGARDIFIKGGHGNANVITNSWFHQPHTTQGAAQLNTWQWPRLEGAFHGSGCTLAAAIAAQLANGQPMSAALQEAQLYCQHSLAQAYSICPGQRIPDRKPTTPYSA